MYCYHCCYIVMRWGGGNIRHVDSHCMYCTSTVLLRGRQLGLCSCVVDGMRRWSGESVVVYKHFYLFPSNQITTRKTAHIYLYEHSLTQRVAVGGTVWLSNETETIFSAGPPTNSVVPLGSFGHFPVRFGAMAAMAWFLKGLKERAHTIGYSCKGKNMSTLHGAQVGASVSGCFGDCLKD